MKAKETSKLAHDRINLDTVRMKKVRGKNGQIKDEYDLMVMKRPVSTVRRYIYAYFHDFFLIRIFWP